MRIDILADFEARRLVANTTDVDALRSHLNAGMVTFYCGFDPTAQSLHVGSLAQIISMRRFQLAGHRPIALVGGATGLIGDPKMAGERSMNPVDLVVYWGERLGTQLSGYFDTDGPNGVLMADNYEWTKNISAIELLRDYGKHFSVNRMLDREAVAARLAGGGISYTEFSYVLLQSLDYLELFRRHNATLQIGGSDQWGNITAGCELIRRVDQGHAHAMTTPLIQKADGTKFGKTESGTVWLDPELTSPYAFYQFWLNADDRDVATYLRTYSLKPVAEVDDLIAQSEAAPHQRIGQRALADELTALVHNPNAAEGAALAGKALFGQAELSQLDPGTLSAALAEAGMSPFSLAEGQLPSMVDLLVASGIAQSRGAARRIVDEGGAYLNNEKMSDADQLLPTSHLLHGRYLVLRRGKKTVAGLELAQ